MFVNKLILGDSLDILSKNDIKADYIFTSPPDYFELDMSPDKDDKKYWLFIRTSIQLMVKTSDLITISISDRKSGGKIHIKHSIIINIFNDFGYDVIFYKIWHKSDKPTINLYRMNFSHIITFAKRGIKVKKNGVKEFKYDVFNEKLDKFLNYTYGLPLSIVDNHIKELTSDGSIVLDPFMGSGTTIEAAVNNGVNYLGIDIDEDAYKKAKMRIGYIDK